MDIEAAGDCDDGEGNALLQWSSIIAAAITASMAATMTARCSGLLSMWRSRAKRVPSGSRSMAHFGHLPGPAWRKPACIGQV